MQLSEEKSGHAGKVNINTQVMSIILAVSPSSAALIVAIFQETKCFFEVAGSFGASAQHHDEMTAVKQVTTEQPIQALLKPLT